jgi:UDP-N-acetylmuramoyl-L-alanyl-D-glutamate--2,6-diaminopimelate ligase
MGVNFNIDGVEFSSLLPGYHSYYAIALSIEALSLLAVNSNIEDLSGYISELKPAFGRGEIIDYVWKDKKQKLQLFLVKNPVGFDLTLELFSYLTEPINLVILINDQIADGKDVSWLWDSQLEKLSLINYHKILIGGSRGLDMNLRIKYAIDSTDRNKVFRSHTQIIDYLADKQLENVKVIATYTAMNEFRDIIV